MKKREALERAIRRHVDAWCETPFVWGRTDCFLSLSDIILEARGYDPGAEFRNRYKTKRGALRVTHQYGGFSGALEHVAIQAGWHEIEPRLAKVGDIGLQRAGNVCGVIKDVSLWVGRNETAFAALPTDQISRAWRVR